MYVELGKEVEGLLLYLKMYFRINRYHLNSPINYLEATKIFSKRFDDFTELMSSISIDSDCLVITGDDLNDKGVKELFDILDTFELSQHVKEATHCKGHTLDLIITKGLSVSDISVSDPSLSNHFCVFFDISFIPDIQIKSNTIKKQYINDYSSASRHLHVATSLLPLIPKKRECRKAERIWRKTKLHVHHDIYKESLRAYNLDLKSARETFFSNIIYINTNNAQNVFAAVDRLTNPPTQITPELLSTQKRNKFASIFTDKIEAIRHINISASN
ncbi:hypothetical protein N1851_006415 [Merluccius polli]|uniref:Uncharacterized protein n=1 Tax=Merluccius polli TaxID=89951 RepID=A0AA47N5P4_MERPO|nr:hypothetical protein N1851_006415 [Merluccius polli]